jgi:hypothetical protein
MWDTSLIEYIPKFLSVKPYMSQSGHRRKKLTTYCATWVGQPLDELEKQDCYFKNKRKTFTALHDIHK